MSARRALPATALVMAASVLATLAGCSSSEDSPSGSPLPNVVPDAQSAADVAAADGGADAIAQPDGDLPPDGPPLGIRDRVGRPLVAQLLVSSANRAIYNQSSEPFTIDTAAGVDGGLSVGADFQSRLVALDAIDGTNDWSGGAADAGADDAGLYPHPLTNVWIHDVLIVDPSLPFSPASYLDVESTDGAQTTCGGRWLADDAIDKTLSFLIKKTTTGVSDGVSAPAKAPSESFPYLAAPH